MSVLQGHEAARSDASALYGGQQPAIGSLDVVVQKLARVTVTVSACQDDPTRPRRGATPAAVPFSMSGRMGLGLRPWQ